MSVAEFQKLHSDLNDLYKSGKHEEMLKHYTDDCYFLTPFQAPYSIKEAPEAFKNPKMQGYDKSELTITVDDVKVYGNLAIDRGHYVIMHEGEKKGSCIDMRISSEEVLKLGISMDIVSTNELVDSYINIHDDELHPFKCVAEFQKLHNQLEQLRKAGKYEEEMKHCTSDCYFMTPFQPPYGIKEAPEVMKSPKLQPYLNVESTITVDDVKVSGDIAIDRGHYVLKHEGERKGSYLVVWRKEGSSWKSAAVCFNFQME